MPNVKITRAAFAFLCCSIFFCLRILHAQTDQPAPAGSKILGIIPGHAPAQVTGVVPVNDADVAQPIEVAGGKVILGNSTVTAKDRTAEIALTRAGTVRLCSTSTLHLSQSNTAAATNTAMNTPALLLALDRGAMELRMPITANDVVLTPDFRVQSNDAGALDLHIRVMRNGDTCMDNRRPELGSQNTPLLRVQDQFGDNTYLLRPGQRVLFEHGSLKDVVDNETELCGCPTSSQSAVSVADATHPFPADISAGLAPAPPPPQAPTGEIHTQISASLSNQQPLPASAPPLPNTPDTNAPTAQTAAPRGDLVHVIGRFFKRLFNHS